MYTKGKVYIYKNISSSQIIWQMLLHISKQKYVMLQGSQIFETKWNKEM
jgi:hypothetical protein